MKVKNIWSYNSNNLNSDDERNKELNNKSKMLKENKTPKKEIGREQFLKHAWDWKHKYGDIILEQLKKKQRTTHKRL